MAEHFMTRWKSVNVEQELFEIAKRVVETGRYRSLSYFISEAIRLRLDELNHKKITVNQIEYPVIHERLHYTLNHMWTMVTPEGKVKTGLSNYIQMYLKGIASIQIEPVGCEVKKGERLGVVETWMFTFDLYSPVSGEISKINNVLKNEPSTINRDPYKEVWLAEIKPNNLITLEEELRDLMTPLLYEIWVIKQGRLRILT